MANSLVEQIEVGRLNPAGAQILLIYEKITGKYAVYRTSERVVVQYADDDDLGDRQRAALAPLNPVRGEINGLIDGWRNCNNVVKRSKAALFDRRVADALITGLQNDGPHAAELLNGIKTDILAERTSVARSQYIVVASAAAVVLIAVIWLVTRPWWHIDDVFKQLWPMAGFGALGALFSISLSIRDRSILTDLQRWDNAVDAVLRIFIGAMSAVILYSLLRAGLVQLNFGNGGHALNAACVHGKPCPPPEVPYFLLVVAFIAGFSERMVSDMLARSSLTPAQSSNPLAGGTPAKAPVGAPLPPLDAGATGSSTPVAANGGTGSDESTASTDGCLTGNPIDAAEHTEDVELPPAAGGVAI